MRISDWSSDVCSSDLIALDQLAHEEADAELNHEVDGERNGDTQYVARQCHDLIALEAEHGDDGEQQCDERYRTYSGQETGFIPFVALGFHQPSARQKSSQKRYAEVDQHRLGDGPETDMDEASLKHEQRRQERKEEPRINTQIGRAPRREREWQKG